MEEEEEEEEEGEMPRADYLHLERGAVVATMNHSQSDAAVNHGQPWQHLTTTIFTGGALGAVLFPPLPLQTTSIGAGSFAQALR